MQETNMIVISKLHERRLLRTNMFVVHFLGYREKLLCLAAMSLAGLILVLILLIGYLLCQAHAKTVGTEENKSDYEMTDVVNNEIYENIPGNEYVFTVKVNKLDDWKKELSTYTSLKRTDDETDEKRYFHLNQNTDQNHRTSESQIAD